MQLTLTSGAPVTFPAPTVADYNNGFVLAPTGILFTVQQNGGSGVNRTTTVSISSSSGNFGAGKALGDLQWRRSDLATWNSMTGAPSTIESHTVNRGTPLNNPWSNTVFFRSLLSWTGDPPAAHSANLTFTLTVTTP